ncbi:unnamed protein product [Bursaphelenchus okinawaensis]|uniref:snRNA-activating protein complex subunit 1 n=1 Tax=Bursaphelenchus okinawaensis TaxID=465554 RepID=A0A811JSM1_9BILA|nr:unnamed protein product [Bursaphelenchus okinawaensis]CAG9080678.1 unnamed protein product [Bursaphelenchus okinawaensis]
MDDSVGPSRDRTKRKRNRRKRTYIKRTDNLSIKEIESNVVSAVMEDIDLLHKDFSNTPACSYREFAGCFLKREFSTIFLGRMNIADLVEFSEMLLTYATSFVFTQKSGKEINEFVVTDNAAELRKMEPVRKMYNLKDRIFGIYLMYTLYFLQPQNSISNIKLSVNQMKELKEFCARELLPGEYFEALFCVHRCVNNHAFMVKPFEPEFNPLLERRFNVSDLLDKKTKTEHVVAPPLTALKEVIIDSTLKEAEAMHEAYQALKAGKNLPEGVNLIKDSIMTRIQGVLAETEEEIRNL